MFSALARKITMTASRDSAENYAATLYLWPQRTLYLGFIGHLSSLSHGAHTLLLGLDQPLAVTVGDAALSARSVLVPAGITYSAEVSEGRIGCCFLDPLGKDFHYHRARMQMHGAGVLVGSEREAEQLEALVDLFDHQADAKNALAVIAGLLFPAPGEPVKGYQADERIRQVVECIRQDPTENISTEELGERVGLSSDRLQRLFKDATGVPIRRYRLWHRLFVISTMMGMGSSLTDAAIAAGFSDSSHLTRVFRNMLGMSPSSVLRRSRQVRILIGDDGE